MIKLIASDVDGTLVPEGSPCLNPELIETIKELKKKGIIFVAASGRQFVSLHRFFEPVANDVIFIAENGGYVTCRGREIECSAMDRPLLEEIVAYMRGEKEGFGIVNTPWKAYTETKDQTFLNMLRNGYQMECDQMEDLLTLDEPIVKASVYFRGDAGRKAAEAKKRFGDRVHIMAAGVHWMDFVRNDVDKGNALARIQDLMRISKEETMAFGDNNNDIGMLLRAGESYAVTNARDEAKQAARYIAESNEHDGVLKVLRTLLQR